MKGNQERTGEKGRQIRSGDHDHPVRSFGKNQFAGRRRNLAEKGLRRRNFAEKGLAVEIILIKRRWSLQPPPLAFIHGGYYFKNLKCDRGG
jgi:hypothetical protein